MPNTRRDFLRSTAGLALTPALSAWLARGASAQGAPPAPGGTPAPPVPPAPAARTPLRLACIGVGNRGWDNLESLRSERIVALCDVDRDLLARAGASCPDAACMADWHQVLDRRAELDVQGVVISTPDHAHFPIASAALRAGLPVYCEKPLTHTRAEAVELRRLAAEAGVPTQLGTQIHASGTYRRVVAAVRGGAIGRVTAVDVWQQKSWGGGRLTPGAVCPPQLDWPLWLCGTPAVPYIEHIHPANWRRYWAYGSGTLGDMGCHVLDLPVWALGLLPGMEGRPSRDQPLRMTVTAQGPAPDDVGCPEWLEATWVIPSAVIGAPDGSDPLVLRWFDGGRKPPFVEEIGAKDRQDYYGRFAVCFIGTKGALFANYDEMLLWPSGLAEESKARAAGEPELAPSPGHHREWLDAIHARHADAPLCHFGYSGRLTELVLAGMDAFRAREAIDVTIS